MISRIREKIESQKAERSRSRSHGRAYYRGDMRQGVMKSCLGVHKGKWNHPNVSVEGNQNTSVFNSEFDPMSAMFKTMEHASLKSNELHNRSEIAPFKKRVIANEMANGHPRQRATLAEKSPSQLLKSRSQGKLASVDGNAGRPPTSGGPESKSRRSSRHLQ